MKLVTGIRAEQTNIDAEGPLTDPSRNIRRDAQGGPILGSNGRPQPITTDPLQTSILTLIDRGAHTKKEYLRLFPSVNGSFNVRENLIARAAWYTSVGRPNFNQYSGGLTLPDTELGPTPTNRITVNNAGIKAWGAQTVNARLEYYFQGVGQLALSAFRREFTNFFGNTTFPATPDFLALYGLDSGTFGDYDVVTQHNLERKVRTTGASLNYRQALTFLPPWARGVQVFGSVSTQRASGEDATTAFDPFVPRSATWGLSLSRERYKLRANWSYRGRHQRAAFTGVGIEPGTHTWGSKLLHLDINAEYYFLKRFALYANLQNLLDAPIDTERVGPSTPAHARLMMRQQFGSLWIFGVKGSF